MSDKTTSQEASRSVQRAIKLLVKSSPIQADPLNSSLKYAEILRQTNRGD